MPPKKKIIPGKIVSQKPKGLPNSSTRVKKIPLSDSDSDSVAVVSVEKPNKAAEAALRKKILSEESDKLRTEANKIALKLRTELELEQRIELTEDQKEAAIKIANGYSNSETAKLIGCSASDIEAWMKIPFFVRHVNELTLKEGSSDKNDRVRKAKRVYEELNEVFLQRVINGDLKNISMKDLNDILGKNADRLDKLLDKKDDTDLGKKDMTVLILNYGKDKSNREYKDIDAFLEDPEYAYPQLEAEYEVVSNTPTTEVIE